MALAAPAAVAGTWHVDAGADAGGDGLSWATAFRHLQDALTHADLAPGDEVRVAAGMYYPDRSAEQPAGSGNRFAEFKLISGVRIFGGFPPGGGDFAARDPDAHPTILSGNLGAEPGPLDPACEDADPAGSDCFTAAPGVAGCRIASCCGLVCEALPSCCLVEWDVQCAEAAGDLCGGRSYHVVSSFGASSEARLDGFTIIDGLADDDSFWESLGAGMLLRYASPRIVRCRFVDHVAAEGGAVMIFGVTAKPLFVNCVFANNWADRGAAARITYGGPDFVNCALVGNTADIGGGLFADETDGVSLVNCTVGHNTAGESGGGAHGAATLTNSIVWGNTPDQLTAAGTVTFSCVEGGHPGEGNIDADPMFAGPGEGDFRLAPGSPCIDRGSTLALPLDVVDLDGDSNLVESLPLDLALSRRTVAGGVDMGAWERCDFDVNGDGLAGMVDLLAVIAAWGTDPGGPPDFDGDGTVGILDFVGVIIHWGPCR